MTEPKKYKYNLKIKSISFNMDKPEDVKLFEAIRNEARQQRRAEVAQIRFILEQYFRTSGADNNKK